jgi:GNAT superfamily N-acetyltransferase
MIRCLTADDIPRALQLASEEGWNQTAADWKMLLELSPDLCFGIEQESQLAATTTLICYGKRLAWLGMVLTRPEFRRRGFARMLVEHALAQADRLGIPTVKLDATGQGQPLYESLGFSPEQEIQRWSRSAASPVHRPALAVPRSGLIEFLCRRADPSANADDLVLYRNGLRASYLGPCVACTAEGAMRLIESTLAYDNGPWFWDILPANVHAANLATRFGFTLDRRLVRMSRGVPLREDESRIYAIAGFEFG